MELLRIDNVGVQTDSGMTLVEPISLSLQAGQNITILGETGSGKSLLIQAIMGALPAGLRASGQIWLENCKLSNLNQDEALRCFWGKKLVMLPQEPRRSLDPIMSIHQQLWESYHLVAKQEKQAA